MHIYDNYSQNILFNKKCITRQIAKKVLKKRFFENFSTNSKNPLEIFAKLWYTVINN